MQIRNTLPEELDEVMAIYASAREFMRASNNPDQWGSTHPSKELIASDIADNASYSVVENGEIVGVFYFKISNDPTYKVIYDGEWLNTDEYGVIHRIAVKYQGRGIVSHVYDFCYDIIRNLKIDTHRQNLPMQRSLAKNGFKQCGVIYLENGAERIAFQRTE